MSVRAMKLPVLLALFIIVTQGTAPPRVLAATSVAINPSADAFVTPGPTNNLSDNNYGAAGALAVAAPGLSKGQFQSVLKFDLSSVKSSFDSAYGPGGWTIQSASLALTAASPNNPVFNSPSAAGQFKISRMVNTGYAEGVGNPNAPDTTTPNRITYTSLTTTYTSPNDETIGTYTFPGGTSGQTSYALNLTPSFQADLLSGDVASLRLVAADTQIAYTLNSRDNPTVANRPVLTVTATSSVPEPASAALLALAGAAILRGKRKP